VAKLEVVEESSGAKKQSWRRPYENPDYTPNCSIRQYWEVWEPGPDRIWMQNSLPFLGVYAPWRSREARGALMKVCTVSDLCKTVLLAAGCEILWMVSSSPHLWHDAMPRDATRSQPSWGALMPSVAQCRGCCVLIAPTFNARHSCQPSQSVLTAYRTTQRMRRDTAMLSVWVAGSGALCALCGKQL
jgi:hypothetical protein